MRERVGDGNARVDSVEYGDLLFTLCEGEHSS